MTKNFISIPIKLSGFNLIPTGKLKTLVKQVNDFITSNAKNNKSTQTNKKLVIAIGTGGTIAMKTVNGLRVPDLDFKSIFKYSDRKLDEIFHVESLDAFQIDSSQMNYSHTRELALAINYIYENISSKAKKEFLGFLILHGTDTMAYSSSAISLMMGQGLPFSIVYTGAQKPIQELMNDARSNLRNSLCTLEALHNQNMAEVFIVMGNKAVLANGAIKIDDENINAFDSPLHRYVAQFDKLRYPVKISSYINKKRHKKFAPQIWKNDFSQTLVIHSQLGLSPASIHHQINDPNIHAIILYSYGATTAHEEIINIVSEAIKVKNTPAFVVNPVNGDANNTLYLSGSKMKTQGLVPLNMSLPAALAKLEIALNQFQVETGKTSLNKINKFMITNFVGEIPENNAKY